MCHTIICETQLLRVDKRQLFLTRVQHLCHTYGENLGTIRKKIQKCEAFTSATVVEELNVRFGVSQNLIFGILYGALLSFKLKLERAVFPNMTPPL